MERSINTIILDNSNQYGCKTAIIDSKESISFQEVYECTHNLQKSFIELGFQLGQVIACELDKTINSALIYYALVGLSCPVLAVTERERSTFDYSYLLSFHERSDQKYFRKIQLRNRDIYVYSNANYAGSMYQDSVYINCTSGTTGGKKFGLTSWKALYTNASGACKAISFQQDKTFLCLFPAFMHFHECVLVPMLVGGTIVLGDMTDLDDCARLICENKVTHIHGTPSQLIQLSTRVNKHEIQVECIQAGGGSLSPVTKQTIENAFGCIVRRSWGSTETTGVCIIDDNSDEDNCLGRPIEGYTIVVYDKDQNCENTKGTGLMVVKGDGLISYLYDGDEKKQINGRLQLNDIITIGDDGRVFFMGREGNMIKCAGNNIYPENIRKVINQHPSVIDSVVLPVNDDNMGEIPAAYVVTNEELNFFELRKYCMQFLPNWMLPKKIYFAKEMPFNSSGKINLRAVKECLSTKMI